LFDSVNFRLRAQQVPFVSRRTFGSKRKSWKDHLNEAFPGNPEVHSANACRDA
jgi:hypothetical protein